MKYANDRQKKAFHNKEYKLWTHYLIISQEKIYMLQTFL